MKNKSWLFFFFVISVLVDGRAIESKEDTKITRSDPKKNISLIIDCENGCYVSSLTVKGQNILAPEGIYTSVRTKSGVYSSRMSQGQPEVRQDGENVEIENISYGNEEFTIREAWSFSFKGDFIEWRIKRSCSSPVILEDKGTPTWNFRGMDTWKGGILDNGGVVWCKYLKEVNDTYGVHTPGVTFWEPVSGNALQISLTSEKPDTYLAAAYSHQPNGVFSFRQYATDRELKPRYDLSRFVYGHADVFKPFEEKGEQVLSLKIQYVDYDKVYSRGQLSGIDERSVRELLNTTARYGVVDNGIVGGNGWTTNWKCMHEPFFGQIAWAVNDSNYTRNLAASLSSERDHALTPEGRMLSRWHDILGDEMPGTYDLNTGYYEAKWGYTVDSQTGYVMNVSELFALTGDIPWIRSHKESCERALDWLIRRDSNGNGIFEMMNNSISDETASDWTDIVWASFENAFVNAQMYASLIHWAEIERVLGDEKRASHYIAVADRLKEAYNKPVAEGGFWDPEKKLYIYWRDKDGSIHGDNLFTPVNFAAIGYGLCDDKVRTSQILAQIEDRTVAESLFHWPLCFDSFKREEVEAGNWPFPRYENGDIFPTWGYLGIRSYAVFDTDIALKYIHKLLHQYTLDGLSSQRYSRATQQGVGSDILSGICTSITALYRDIYGVCPHWDYLEVNPHLTGELNGTSFDYWLRGIRYHLTLHKNDYALKFNGFEVNSKIRFGAASKERTLFLYAGDAQQEIRITNTEGKVVRVALHKWDANGGELWLTDGGDYQFALVNPPGSSCVVTVNGKKIKGSLQDGEYQFLARGKAGTVISISGR